MQQLKELIGQINVPKVQNSAYWSDIIKTDSKIGRLFTIIYEGKAKTDEEAAAIIYPDEKAGSKYNNLKERLKERLLNAIFLLELRNPGKTDRQRAYMDCSRHWAAAMMLISQNGKRIGISLLESLLKETFHFEFTELSVSILSQLKLHYAVIGDHQKHDYYLHLYLEYQKIWLLETEAEDAYAVLTNRFMLKKGTEIELAEEATIYYNQIADALGKYSSFRLQLCGRLLESLMYGSKNDFSNAVLVCENAIRFFKNKPFDSNLPLQAFYYRMIVCFIKMQSFERGQEIMRNHREIYVEGSFNWYKIHELYFLLALHSKKYAEAENIFYQIHKTIKKSENPFSIREIWKIYEAYIVYLAKIGKINPLSDPEHIAGFKIARFNNEIPEYSKDKRGMNIPILVIQILFAIVEKNYGQSIDRIEAIKKYCSRYLKKNDTYRSNCFINALLQIPAANFHKDGVIRRADKYIRKMNLVSLEVEYQLNEVEIIPYNDLWEMVLDSLQNRIVRTTTKSKKQ